MSWNEFHNIAEELSLWSTLLINAVLIAGAIPTAVAAMRKVPRRTLIRVASIGGGVGLVAVTTAFIIWVTASPHPFEPALRDYPSRLYSRPQCGPSRAEIQKTAKTPEEQRQIMVAMESSVGGCIILGGEPPDWYER
ncbi:hypothetical protein FHS83_001817 [Rhizomicrobium palustre]|uniref:Uncharacterized protein n=1 Tax=Rhizomicrobium palustre TaxID=189966 RepID=A0A846MZ25_9PROT|nr:hypothetical protein [Rhizomicrobium palustre]NIK88499.1 hypothetical protein [Rhizomicrobium palustre]